MTAKPKGSKGLSEERMAAARKFLEDFVRTKFDGNASRAAESFHMSQSQFSEVLRGKSGLGIKMLEAIADKAGTSIDRVIGRELPAEEVGRVLAESLIAARAGRLQASPRKLESVPPSTPRGHHHATVRPISEGPGQRRKHR